MKLLLPLVSLCVITASAQGPATIRVDAARASGAFAPITNYFGYDEPNFTYTKNGRKLIGELAALSRSPVYIRTHFILASGNGQPSLKFGSTNVYTEDASGKPVYDWTIIDRILGTYLDAGARPFVEIGFMPEALSSKPQPYQVEWVPGARNAGYSAGWSYPPKDFDKWGELIRKWMQHISEKYGAEAASTWYFEVWNEPDISYWHGTPEEYDRLYDVTAAAVKKVLPHARVGGPASTGPAGQRAGEFLRQFLAHCEQAGTPLDFITFHAKGRPQVVEGHVRMGISKNTQDVDKGFQIVASFPKFRSLPIVISESDPEGCAACSARVYPQNAYRNGPLYASYEALMMKNIRDLAQTRGTNIAGMLTWAFEFENQPYFDGLRTLATNGIDKPVLNVFRMAGMMEGDRVAVESSASLPLERIEAEGVRNSPDIDALAARGREHVSVLVWNYHDDDAPAPAANVNLELTGIPGADRRVLVHQYAIDETNSNAWAAWKKMGSPQQPTPEQYAQLEAAGQLQEAVSPQWMGVRRGALSLSLKLQRQEVRLVRLEL
jgi:xylan 1,4-beta-xylosidase